MGETKVTHLPTENHYLVLLCSYKDVNDFHFQPLLSLKVSVIHNYFASTCLELLEIDGSRKGLT